VREALETRAAAGQASEPCLRGRRRRVVPFCLTSP